MAVALVVVIAATAFGALPAWARPHRTVRWEAVAAASITQLAGKGFTGFSVERERRGSEIEREFATKKAAQAEVDALRAKGFRARLERS